MEDRLHAKEVLRDRRRRDGRRYRALLLGSRLKRCLPGIKYFEWFYGFGKDMALAALSCAFSQQEPSRELFDKALKNYFIPSLYPFQIIRLDSNELYRSYDDSKYAAAVFLGFFEKDLQSEELKKAACDAMCNCFGKYVKDMFAVRSVNPEKVDRWLRRADHQLRRDRSPRSCRGTENLKDTCGTLSLGSLTPGVSSGPAQHESR